MQVLHGCAESQSVIDPLHEIRHQVDLVVLQGLVLWTLFRGGALVVIHAYHLSLDDAELQVFKWLTV